jgi:hypothetical protein
MRRVTATFDLTNVEMKVLEFEAKSEDMTVNELIAWMVRQNIPPFLDVLETPEKARCQELKDMLVSDGEAAEMRTR